MDAGRRTHTHLFLCPFSPSPTRAPCSVFVFALSTVEAIIFYKKKTLKELLVVVRSYLASRVLGLFKLISCRVVPSK